MSHIQYPELTSTYFVDTGPHPRETIDSFTDRILPLNFEYDIHQKHLIKRGLAVYPELATAAVWERVLAQKTGTDPHQFQRAADSGLRHGDNSVCDYCTNGADNRWLCTDCAGDDDVKQYPHLDTIVCLRHLRWAGPDTYPAQQRYVGDEITQAEGQFRQLRASGRLDAVLYVLLRDAFRVSPTRQQQKTDDMTGTDITIFPLMMATAMAITTPEGMRALFDPGKSYTRAFETLTQQVTNAIGQNYPDVIRRIWLYLRPSFLTIRERLLGIEGTTDPWAHDFPIPDRASFSSRETQPCDQPFSDYLKASGEYKLTEANWEHIRTHHFTTLSKRRTQDTVYAICRAGHRMAVRISSHHFFAGADTDWCRICDNYQLLSGFNDLQTVFPEIAALYRSDDNYGIEATQILVGSSKTHVWVCPADSSHKFTSTVANRIVRKSDCSICTNRIFIPSVNDFATRWPSLAEEWHPTENDFGPDEINASSSTMAWWRCRFGHEWQALISSRIQGHGCHRCAPRKPRYGIDDFETRHFDLACEWDWERNEKLTPGQIAGSSNDTFHWVCPTKGHRYQARADRRVAGAGCGKCNHRVLAPGETDVASRYPDIAIDWNMASNEGLGPHQVMPGTTLRNWKCVFGHSTRQSVPNRVKSCGCTKCEPELRSAWLRKM